ncbi:MAG: PAS domain-containing protein, partial [Chloroflexi bacterium]|nr:PAS domain-containing protein [Chloroflexota bacterium]
ILVGSGVMLFGSGVIYSINRFGSTLVASALFLLLLLVVLAFSDVPEEVANGRSLFVFTIPITMASVLLRPWASFIIAGLAGAIVAGIGVFALGFAPNMSALFGFLLIALVSWLAARSLERALADLRTINRELDQRVADRTRDLAEALQQVQSESSKNQAILESIADGVIVFDNAGHAIVANPAMQLLTGWGPEATIGKSITELMQDTVAPDDQEMIRQLLRERQATRAGLKFGWGEKTLSLSLAPVQSDSETLGSVVVLRDFTREAELDRLKSAFVSMTSHELRTPLNAILGYADMLKEGVYESLNDDQTETVERIYANGKRLLGLVNNILDQAQIEAGRLSIKIAPFDPHDFTHELKMVMGGLAEQKGLYLKTIIDDSAPPRLSGDYQRLQQIAINLVGNAIKFTDEGGITLRIFRPDQEQWALEVVDTGAGIPSEALGYIFEPFRQVGDPTTRHRQGSGLGLSIVKQLVSHLGGYVTATSQVGRGSRFLVTLPLAVEKEIVM